MALESRIQEIFQEVFDDPSLQINATTSRADIADWDSVAQVKLVLAIEESFSVQFTTDDVGSFSSVSDIVTMLHKRGVNN